jgi:general secretion pathway protein C
MPRLSRLVEILLALCLVALVAFWVVRLSGGTSLPIPPTATASGPEGASRVDQVLASARLFGSRPPGALSDNVRALGVVADETGRGSVIVSVDGQTPRVYRIGDTLDGRLVTAIRPTEIELEAGGARQVFRLPAARAVAPGLTIIGAGPASSQPSPYAAPYAPPPPSMPVQPQLAAPPPPPGQGVPYPQVTSGPPPGMPQQR